MPRYSEQTIVHFDRPYNPGALPDADLVGCGGREGHGPFIKLHLRVSGGQITAASSQTFGCPAAIASGSAMAKLVEGRSLAEADRLTQGDIDAELGGLPRNKRHCLSLAMSALENALSRAEQYVRI